MELILIVIPALLAIVTGLWGVYRLACLLWRRSQRETSNKIPAEQQYSIAERWVLVIVGVVLAAVIGSVASIATIGRLSNVGALGWWFGRIVDDWIHRSDLHYNIGLVIMSALIVNSAICFAILWGGYLLSCRFRRRSSADESNDEIQRRFW